MGGIKRSKFRTGRYFLAVDVVAQGSRVVLTSGTPLQNVMLTFLCQDSRFSFSGPLLEVLFNRLHGVGVDLKWLLLELWHVCCEF